MSFSNIALTFKKCKQEHRPALLTYIVSGDPNKKKSFEILKSISKHADICEVGSWTQLQYWRWKTNSR